MVDTPPKTRTAAGLDGWARLRQRAGARLEPRLRRALRDRVEALLAGRQATHGEAVVAIDGLRQSVLVAGEAAGQLYARLDRSPFVEGLTVHAAHARHPGVGVIFARHGLPRCPDCAVGADETLAEAAFGEGLELAQLLNELNKLLTDLNGRPAT